MVLNKVLKFNCIYFFKYIFCAIIFLIVGCKDNNDISLPESDFSRPIISWKEEPKIIPLPEIPEEDLLNYELQIENLVNGEAFVVDLTMTYDYMNDGTLDLFLGKNGISLSMYESDLCMEVKNKHFLVEFSPYYDKGLEIKEDNSTINLSLVYEKVSSGTARWALVTPFNVYWSTTFIENEVSLLKITTNRSIGNKLKFNEISYGLLDPSLYNHNRAIEAVQLPREIETPKLYLKYDNKEIPGVNTLILNGIDGKVTQEEMNSIIYYFLKRPLFTTNYNNTIFSGWNKAYMMKWVFDKTGDTRILDRMIEQSEKLYKYRDDNYGKYKTLIKKENLEFVKGWSHFRGVCYYDNIAIKKMIGISDIGTGTNFPAATALTIASHPELWEQSIGGKTYKDIAYEMLDYVYDNWDYAITNYYDSSTNLLKSPKFASEPEGYVPQWNRLFPLMASGNSFVDALDLLSAYDVRANKVDEILKALFKHFWDNARIENYAGKDIVYYPYGVYRLETNPDHTEDINHMGFDSRGFRVFHNSGRYWNEEQTRLISNLLCYRMIKDESGTFTERQNSDVTIKNYNNWDALPDMMWYAEFDDNLKNKLLKYVYDEMNKKNSLDGRVVFYVLHYRALKYGIK